MKDEKRQWQARETRMVAEYIQLNYKEYPYRMRVRLGSISNVLSGRYQNLEEERMAGSWRRWADAVIFKPDQIVIIEASIRADPGDISRLKLYKLLFPHTPEMQPYASLPITLELVYAMLDEVIVQLARQEGIKVVEYKPPWLNDYLSILYPRERRVTPVNITDLGKQR